jgi:hypothetical protein
MRHNRTSGETEYSVIIGLVIILWIMGYCISDCARNRSSSATYTGSPNASRSNSSSDTTDAWIFTKELIRRELSSPSTAKFEFAGHRGVKYLGNNRYSFSSYVDSQNGFGAMVRTRFSGIIRETNNGWVMEEFNYE